MAMAAHDGAGNGARIIRAKNAAPRDFLEADAYLFVCPENLASLSGEMKEMFDQCYYPLLGEIEGRAYCTAIAAGSDGENAERQIDRIATGWRLRRVAEGIIVNLEAQTTEEILAQKTVPSDNLEQCRELGRTMQEGLAQINFTLIDRHGNRIVLSSSIVGY